MPQTANIFYSISGGGQYSHCPPIILIHGAGSNHLCWPAELRRLPGYTVYALDLPGHGRSTGTGQHTIENYASHVIDFLSSLGIYQAYLVGHSMGGAIALQAASSFPHLVKGLGLIACAAYIETPPELLEHLSNPVMAPVALDWLRARLFSPATPDTIILKTMAMLEKARPGVLYGDWKACAQFDMRAMLGRISTPAWVAAGADDRLTPPAYATFLANQLRAIQFQLLPAAGHMVILERPRDLEQGLIKFLSAISCRNQ